MSCPRRVAGSPFLSVCLVTEQSFFTPYKGMGIQEGHDAARVGATEKGPWVDGDGNAEQPRGRAPTRVVSTPL